MNGRVPSYLHHKSRDLAKVVINGKTHYLGRYNSAESIRKYNRLISQHFKDRTVCQDEVASYIREDVEKIVKDVVKRSRRSQKHEASDFLPYFTHIYRDYYPAVPPPMFDAELLDLESNPLPDVSGIYFVWRQGVVVYVGKSVNIRKRVTMKHENILEGDQISWVAFDTRKLNFAECYFIGICRPMRNFGSFAKH